MQIHVIQFFWSLVLWIGLHEATYLRDPGRLFLLTQLLAPAVLAALFLRFTLFQATPAPILHLPDGWLAQALTICLSFALTSGMRAVLLVRDWRFPIWGEARLLRGVTWGLATGAAIFFTAAGRAFLRERFQVTPREFLQTVA